MKNLKSIFNFKNEKINSIELKVIKGGIRLDDSSKREENVETGIAPGATEPDKGFKLDGIFNPYPKPTV